jgi:hypothetical protein
MKQLCELFSKKAYVYESISNDQMLKRIMKGLLISPTRLYLEIVSCNLDVTAGI